MNHQSARRTIWASRVRPALHLLRHRKQILAGLSIVVVYFIVAITVLVGDLLHARVSPYNPIQPFVGAALAPPSWSHLFGTDEIGRDVLSRVIAATPDDFFIGIVVVSIALAIGMTLGSYAGFRGGLIDEALMRVTDIFFALPALVLALAIGVALGPGIRNMTIALLIVWWPAYARLSRGEALKVAHNNYIEAAKLSGFGRFRTLLRHVLPNIITTLLVYATLDLGGVVLAYSGLSFLGLSVTPPAPDWGQMVSAYEDYMVSAPWLPVLPGLVIAVLIIAYSLLGDGLRDLLDRR